MKHRVFVLSQGMVLAGACVLALLSACTDKAPQGWAGYAEGNYVYVSSPLGGQLTSVSVQAGQQVEKGAALFSLDATSEQAAQNEAQARLSAAQSQAANLNVGKRREEIAVIQAQLTQARAAEKTALNEYQRQQQLVAQGFVSKSRLDDALSAKDQSHARVSELVAALEVAQLPARRDERAAQAANTVAAQASLRQSQWRTQQKQQTAVQAALVADVFFREGEYVAPGQPVLSLLPPGHLKARFYVPEQQLSSVQMGGTVRISCDGCGDDIMARVVHIASQPEYTPPVIYSNSQRAKLVFMVEALPEAQQAMRLKPGQPLDVRWDSASKP